jgi:5-(carboxyamino)imidazole ribonucleotide synthase
MTKQFLPGATLGVLGGGQLGRMFCVAARTAGYRLVVLDPDPESPAGKVADEHIQAEFTDQLGLDTLAGQCDVITTEFENVPAESLHYLAQNTPVYPAAKSFEVAQNRIREKQFAKKAGLEPVPFYSIQDESDLYKAIEQIGLPAILKSATLGYDGKGQYVINRPEDLDAIFRSLKNTSMEGGEYVLEKKIDLAIEVSAIVARNEKGVVCYPIVENEHRDGILHMSIVPARVDDILAEKVRQEAMMLAEALAYKGVLAVEFFVSTQGELFFNEMAPRPHNSGHFTTDACVTSQFEQQFRMMCGLKPGDTRLISPVVMVNMLGDLWPLDWEKLLIFPEIKLHLYGKKEARPGRKMGHFNVLAPTVEQALDIARLAFEELTES